jgi:Na+-transporting methylmalonyl-CoA/oxaloacetate decarboxylase gamma subunit
MLLLALEHGVLAFRFTLEPLYEESGLALAAMGILVVFMALVLVSLFITLLPRLMAALDRLHPEEKPAEPATAKASKPADGLSEEIQVVIAAAVAATIGTPQRIVRIRGLTPEDLGWSLEGRIQHHTSHRIQPRNRR